MITVVRIENIEQGMGIFGYMDELERYPLADETYRRHLRFNTPDEDGLDLRMNGQEWFCAYKSLSQFEEWVKREEAQFFIQNGFKIVMLDITDYQIGRDQVIFTKESIVQEVDITNIFN